MPFDMLVVREKLAAFDLKNLFVDGLGWNLPKGLQTIPVTLEGEVFHAQPVAQLGGVVVFTVVAPQAGIPDGGTRQAISREIAQHYHENLLIFLDRSPNPTQSLWYWVKREGGKSYPREHLYVVGQSGDLILSKIRAMFVDLSDLNANGDIAVAEATRRVRQALDVEAVTKRFYTAFQEQHLAFLDLIGGIGDARDRRWYASVLLNRLMFIYFLQRKGFLNDNREAGLYLQKQLAASQGRGLDRYYREFLQALFFEGFAKPAAARNPQAALLVGNIPYLNGGLFLPHPIEVRWPAITIPDSAFVNLLRLFEHYSWNLDDTPGGRDNELNPNVLGYIFEKYINQKAFGAYYTRPEITEYLCEQTIHRLILQAVNTPPGTPAAPGIRIYAFDSVADLLLHLDVPLCRLLKEQVLPQLRLLDPACGSGAFLVAAMKTLVDVYASVIGHIDALNAPDLKAWINGIRQAHPNPYYYIKNRIITQNLFGVDWMEEATEIAKLRLFLALVASAQTVEELEPLPNIDFNILAGDSLIGLLRVEPQQIAAQGGPQQQSTMFQNLYTQQLAEKNRLLAAYRDAASYTSDLQALRDSIQQHRDAAWATLDGILLNEFGKLGIRYEEATWDTSKSAEGPVRKRPLTEADIQALRPFHWGYEFDGVLEAGGFDAIITNPPWDILKPNAKEFFAEHSTLISKKKMRIEEFESAQAKLLTDPEIRAAWLAYESRFPYVSAYFRSAAGYANQISLVNGKKAGTDINLYKLFVEQCYNLLRPGGQCGIVIPSGIYTDLGTKQLREMLFSAAEITGLFGFENRRGIFEGVDSRFKFVVLTFEKGGHTSRFPAAFMHHDVADLAVFPQRGGLPLAVEMIRRLSPDSLSVMEFKSDQDVQIAEKMLRFPLLGEHITGKWNLRLTAEFHMTGDSGLFRTAPEPGRLPLYEGKMIHQFTNHWGEPRYWVDEQEGRAAIVGRQADTGQKLDYQDYRLGFRDIASNTNERTLIATIIPPTFHGNKVPTVRVFDSSGNRMIKDVEQLFLAAVWNSFVMDAMIRLKVTTTINFFYIYQLPVPRLTQGDPAFSPIVERAAKLICTTPEFDALAAEVGLGGHTAGVTDPVKRAELRAELDALVAHLYGLTAAEFTHILATFPLVPQTTRDAALAAYHVFAPHPDDAGVAALIAGGERAGVEFKLAAYFNPVIGREDRALRLLSVEAVTAFLNSQEGGILLIGVANDGTIVGVNKDYEIANPQKKDRDGYELALRDVIGHYCGPDIGTHYEFSFHQIQGHDVCRIRIQPARRWVFLDGKFPVRIGNRKLQLDNAAAFAYQQQHPR